MLEIERKFRVTPEFAAMVSARPLQDADDITQGYLSTDPKRTIRVRTLIRHVAGGPKSFNYMTVKGKKEGASAPEIEFQISAEHATELFKLCIPTTVLRKARFRYPIEGYNLTAEVDVFKGAHVGLVVAEVELPSEKTRFIEPTWFGKDVTEDARYSNSSLAVNPHAFWKTDPYVADVRTLCA